MWSGGPVSMSPAPASKLHWDSRETHTQICRRLLAHRGRCWPYTVCPQGFKGTDRWGHKVSCHFHDCPQVPVSRRAGGTADGPTSSPHHPDGGGKWLWEVQGLPRPSAQGTAEAGPEARQGRACFRYDQTRRGLGLRLGRKGTLASQGVLAGSREQVQPQASQLRCPWVRLNVPA